MIEARDLSVKQGQKWIVRAVDFLANAGQITVIAGPNGSGKTTLLNALSQDLSCQGTILINKIDVTILKPWQKAKIRGVLPQSSTLSFPFLVREIVTLGLSAGNASAENLKDKDIPEYTLKRVDLQGFGHRFYQELSGGEQVRVQLARVLCQIWNARYARSAMLVIT